MVRRKDTLIPDAVIEELHLLQTIHNMSLIDAVIYLRGKLVPAGYDAYPFRSNTPESFLDKLRSLVATYRYRGQVAEFKEQGIDFSTYMYIPEVDPLTGDIYHEREDHCHILKRIWKHTREGGPEWVDLKGFDEALMNPTTGLTHAALTSERKQSVQDAERMLSFKVASFLKDHGYEEEARYVDTIAGWHEVADGGGLTELKRCKLNYVMLNMVLDEWMPWHVMTMISLALISTGIKIKFIKNLSK